MKNFTLGLNIILIIAVAILFYLHFSSPKKVVPTTDKQVATGNFKVAYFEMDSIENHYEYLKEVRKGLRDLEQQKSNELAAKKNAFKSKLEQYRNMGKSMSQEDMAKAQEDLQRMDNDLKNDEQVKMQELQDESVQKIQQVKKKIEEYLKEYNKSKNFSYILASSPDIMYYKDSVYSITNDVLKGLNDAYKKNKKP